MVVIVGFGVQYEYGDSGSVKGEKEPIRQGDIILFPIEDIPTDDTKMVETKTLAAGEGRDHLHNLHGQEQQRMDKFR